MAIELQIEGEFELSKELERSLLGTLPAPAKEVPNPREGVQFRLESPLISVTGFYSASTVSSSREYGELHTNATLFFRVLDKNRVIEAVNYVVRCANAVLKVTEGDLMMFFGGDRPLLERRGKEIILFLHEKEEREEFWYTDERTQLLDFKYRFVRWKRRHKKQT